MFPQNQTHVLPPTPANSGVTASEGETPLVRTSSETGETARQQFRYDLKSPELPADLTGCTSPVKCNGTARRLGNFGYGVAYRCETCGWPFIVGAQ